MAYFTNYERYPVGTAHAMGRVALPYSLKQLGDWLSRGGMALGAPPTVCLQGKQTRAAIVFLGPWAPCMFAPSGTLPATPAPALRSLMGSLPNLPVFHVPTG